MRFHMNHTRRSFLESLGLVGASMLIPTEALLALDRRGCKARSVDTADPDFKALAAIAIDTATRAGATYVDVRMTRTNRLQLSHQTERESEDHVLGVRVLANGAWGFAAHVDTDADTLQWLGTTATALAKANAWAGVPPVELEPASVVTGTWQTPMQIDPFEAARTEKYAPVKAFIDRVKEHGGKGAAFQLNCERQNRLFASSTGSLTEQRIYTTTNAQMGSRFFSPHSTMTVVTQNDDAAPILQVSPVGGGWEAITNYEQYIPEGLEHAARLREATVLDQPGRYEVVFDGAAMAAFVSAFGQATEVDRVLGLETSSGESSFLSPIQEQLGKQLLPTSITITADRSMVGGAATVSWDDEGVVPSSYPVIQSGVLMHYAHGRERLSELQRWYATQKIPFLAHGAMASGGARSMPLISTPNLTLAPTMEDTSFTDLLSGITNGFAVLGGSVDTDQRILTGWGSSPLIYAVRNGRLAEPIKKAAYSFSMLDHWKNIVVLGGPKTVMTQGFSMVKGVPSQRLTHSVRACAARIKDVAIRPLGASNAF